jgi:hypothetical protein
VYRRSPSEVEDAQALAVLEGGLSVEEFLANSKDRTTAQG